jgi:hypothetical protein
MTWVFTALNTNVATINADAQTFFVGVITTLWVVIVLPIVLPYVKRAFYAILSSLSGSNQ